ncbi:MAG: tRNA pseudouridine(55) synthase TruB [Woeseia sp.]
MAAPSAGRPRLSAVNGLLLLNKPAGLTSNQALQKVKRLLKAKKAGHTGSLDPAATGMLPLCFGEATKVCAYLLEADKSYRVTARLGEATDTGDADGTVNQTAAVPALSAEQWEGISERFIGDIEQVPPMYSALKQQGKRLYELARKGQVVEREARRVKILELDLLEAHGARLVFRVRCSKGTYVRTLVEDIAKAGGTVAHTAALHRETVGHFCSQDMLELAAAESIAAAGPEALLEYLLPPDRALQGWPELTIASDAARSFADGQVIAAGRSEPAAAGPVRVYDATGFLGVGELSSDGRLTPRRLFRAAR